MRAAVFHKVGEPLTIENIADPKPDSDELVIKVKSCGICGSDLHMATVPPGLPSKTVMGHEFAGEVVEIGANAKSNFKIGDRVTSMPYIGCGKCEYCLTGDGTLCATMKGTGLGQIPGAYAEYVLAGATETLKLPESVSYEDGSIVEPLSVGLHAVNQSQLNRGGNVLVIGAGPIGLSVALWARFFGARHVVVSEKVEGRLARADKFGATGIVHAGKDNVPKTFRNITGGQPDIVFECVGVPGMISQCIQTVRRRGRVVVVGVCMQQDNFMPVLGIVKEVTLTFVLAYKLSDFKFTLDMLDSGRIEPGHMVTDKVGMDGFCDAFSALTKPTDQCKVVLNPEA